MTDFSVWAPKPDRVRLWTSGPDGERVHALTRGDDGWWRLGDPGAAAGVERYAYLIGDDETPIPDPRSRRQPDGVHKPSAIDNGACEVGTHTDTGWTGKPLAGSVIYEMHIGTFTPDGTLDSAADRLDHLESLGVDFVELLPVNAWGGEHGWGYDGVLWYAVHEPYGGPDAYRRFVDAAHDRGIGVIQDVVYNHLGPTGNYLPQFGPYLRENSSNTWGDSVNLDGPGSDEVRRYIIDNALMWLRDFRVDGLRLDAVHALRDTRAVHILEELAAEVDVLEAEAGRTLTLIAESDLNDPRLITSREAGGYGLDAQWDDDVHHALHVALTGETGGYYADFAQFGALAKALRHGFFHDGTYSSFRERHHGRPIDEARVPTSRLVVFTQDHDQIGNRAAGDRLSQTLGADNFCYGKLAVAATLNLLGPFTPMLFMGEEWGAGTPWQFFSSYPEPELATATAEGRLREFARMGWDPATVPNPQDPSTFTNSRLDWSEPDAGDHARLLRLYRELIAARKRLPGLTDPRFSTLDVADDTDARWLTIRRPGAVVVANLSDETRSVPLGGSPGAHARAFRLEVSTADGIQPGDVEAQLPAWSAAVLSFTLPE